MRLAFAPILLFMAGCLFQAANPQTSSTQTEKAAQPDSKLKTLSGNWVVSIPFVACENGTPVPNVELPETNAPTPMCMGVQAPDVLPVSSQSTASEAPDESSDVGTVIVMGVSHEKIVLAADSRNVRLTMKTKADGTVEGTIGYDGCACKLTQLTPTMLFAADGQVSSRTTIPAAELYDAHKLAKLAAQNYHSNPQEEKLAGGRIAAIATRWAWDVDFRMHHGFVQGWKPIDILEGIFAGLEPNGDIRFAVARLEYPKRRNGFHVPPVMFTISILSPLPKDFTWVEAFGIKDVARTYYSARFMTTETKTENKRISAEILKDPKLFDAKVPEHLVELTVQHYEATTTPDKPLFVHGPVDVAVLERNKGVSWIRSKNCSGAKKEQ